MSKIKSRTTCTNIGSRKDICIDRLRNGMFHRLQKDWFFLEWRNHLRMRGDCSRWSGHFKTATWTHICAKPRRNGGSTSAADCVTILDICVLRLKNLWHSVLEISRLKNPYLCNITNITVCEIDELSARIEMIQQRWTFSRWNHWTWAWAAWNIGLWMRYRKGRPLEPSGMRCSHMRGNVGYIFWRQFVCGTFLTFL